jgi:hypothetical protein
VANGKRAVGADQRHRDAEYRKDPTDAGELAKPLRRGHARLKLVQAKSAEKNRFIKRHHRGRRLGGSKGVHCPSQS